MGENNGQQSIAQIEQFDFRSDFNKWIKRFQRYRVISGLILKNDEEQVNALVYCMGPAAEEIFASFGLDDAQSTDYKLVLEKFKFHFTPKINVVYERAKFNRRLQKEGESIEEFITSLYTLSENCNYGILREELIRDQIVVGVNDKRLSERLQMDYELTLEKAVNQARQTEEFKKQHKVLEDKVSEIDRIQQKKKIERKTESTIQGQPNQKYCYRCGGTFPHINKNCPAFNAECNKCGKIGHFVAVCRSKDQPRSRKRFVRKVEEENLSASSSEEGIIGEISGKENTEKWSIKLMVDKTPHTFKIDSGADETVMPASCIQRQKKNK